MNGSNESIKVNGVIENVVYHNDNNDYTVLEIVVDDSTLITAVGIMPMAFEGEKVTLVGSYTFHKEFGRQFAFETFEKTMPDDVDGILQYLSSKTVKGVGPVTALKIVNRFGSETFDVMENHPEWLADIPGITMKKAAAISESFREQSEIRGVMMFCKDYMGKGDVTKVYKRFGAGAIGIIKENPYVLCSEELAISFEIADEIAKSLDIEPENENRVRAGIEYALSYNAQANGHTCLPMDKLIGAASQILGIAESVAGDFLTLFLERDEFSSFLRDSELYVMKNSVSDDEKYIAKRIFEMQSSMSYIGTDDVYSLIAGVEAKFGVRYAALQREALFEAISGSLLILTGGPGTGKTTVVKGLLSVYASLGLKCVLSAPTGRAAKRLSEATGKEAKTIHRMLEMERGMDGEMKFGRNVRNPIDEAVIIVDEASMIDLALMAALFRAIKRGARLIIIGDADQLPSVGAGNVLADLIASKSIKTVALTEIFRQSRESLIVTNAHKINAGDDPILNDTKNDFFFVRREMETEIAKTVADLIMERLPKTYGKNIRDEIQIITPSKKGYGGVAVLNAELQLRINPPQKFKKEIKKGDLVFREGDKVMQTSNNYEIEWEKNGAVGMGIFNGDIGFIEEIDLSKEEMRIRFDDRIARYSFELCDELDLAYAITVHKSQGSEYPVVIIPMYYCAPMLMTRNLFYTAVTRAKKMVILVGRTDIPHKMVQNNREIMRYTTLSYRIIDLCS